MSDEENSTDEISALQGSLQQSLGATAPAADGKLKLLGARVHNYDVPALSNFINTVFHTMPDPDAHRLVYSAKTNLPFYPLASVTALETLLNKISAPRALYFCASSGLPLPADDPRAGQLSHKKEVFSAYHVLVLDDIGTKIDKADVPEGLRDPSYIIESSAGNYQYGYVLTDPITDYEHAQNLIRTVAMAGLTDTGGAAPCKVVRLPAGVNGKETADKHDYPVTLVSMNQGTFTPDEILTAIGHELPDGSTVTWERITDGLNVDGSTYSTAGFKKLPKMRLPNGVIDEVVEWLNDVDMLRGDNGGEYLTIECPWAALHSEPSAVDAGYSPLGRGENPQQRKFHCFHDACSEHHTVEFLQFVLSESDIDQLAMYHTSKLETNNIAYVPATSEIYDLNTRVSLPVSSVAAMYSIPMRVYREGMEKPVGVKPVDYWLSSPYCSVVNRKTFDVGQPQIYTDTKGTPCLNTFTPYPWSKHGPIDKNHVDKFLDFVEYLLPDDDQFNYFIDWFCAKMQNPAFRGTGIIMMTETFGIGRSTLVKLMRRIVGGADNHQDIGMKALLGNFNPWVDKLMVTVAEAHTTNATKYQLAEELKDHVDTSPRDMTMNLKNQQPISVTSASSWLICTNNPDAIPIAQRDRRFTVMQNPEVPKPVGYYIDLSNWIEKGDGMEHIYRWALGEKVDLDLLAQPLETTVKLEMISAAASTGARVAAAIANTLVARGIYAIGGTQMNEVLSRVALEIDPEYADTSTKYKNRCAREVCKTTYYQAAIDGQVTKLKVFNAAVAAGLVSNADDALYHKTRPKTDAVKEQLKTAQLIETEKLVAELVDLLGDGD